jgi:hypothetical protein
MPLSLFAIALTSTLQVSHFADLACGSPFTFWNASKCDLNCSRMLSYMTTSLRLISTVIFSQAE